MEQLIYAVRKELHENIDEKTKQSFQRFFKEEVKYYGLSLWAVNKISKKYLKEIKAYDKKQAFKVCEELLKSDYCEEAFVVSNWLPHFVNRMEPQDLELFRAWIDKYINNWAKCDGFCNHTVGDLVQKYPQLVGDLKSWAKSENRWLKRAAAVSLIVPAKKGKFLEDAIEIADTLIADKDDMVQKGYGWLLKEASRQHQKEVFDYVMKNKAVMPRTALRYAIELMPKELKSQAMAR